MNSPCVNCGADSRVCKECDWYNGVWISKDQYEARLKADLKAILVELQLEIEECVDGAEGSPQFEQGVDIARCQVVDIIQQKIDSLKENESNE